MQPPSPVLSTIEPSPIYNRVPSGREDVADFLILLPPLMDPRSDQGSPVHDQHEKSRERLPVSVCPFVPPKELASSSRMKSQIGDSTFGCHSTVAIEQTQVRCAHTVAAMSGQVRYDPAHSTTTVSLLHIRIIWGRMSA